MRQLARSPRARAMALFFGMQSMQPYVAFGWLAQIYRDAGVSMASAGPFVVGWLHALTAGWAVPLAALAASSVLMGWSGWKASAPRMIDDELAEVGEERTVVAG